MLVCDCIANPRGVRLQRTFNVLVKEKNGMIQKGHLEIFSKPLTSLLESELHLGNEIVETSKGWPHQDSIIVFLKCPFHKKYEDITLVYSELNDSHYWQAEYSDTLTNHTLACKF